MEKIMKDIKEYGIFDGKPLIPRFNREERREYVRNLKGNRNATLCPKCHKKTLKVTDDKCNLVCELCGKIVKENKNEKVF